MSLPTFSRAQLLFPGAASWERWAVVPGRDPELLERPETGESEGFRSGEGLCLLALPGLVVESVPFVTSAPDPQSLFSSAHHFLEQRQVGGDPDEAGVQIVAGRPPRSLARIDVPLQYAPKKPFEGINADVVVAAPALMALEPRSLALWTEFGETVAAFERNGHCAYYSIISGGSIEEIAARLRETILRLQGQGVIESVSSIQVWNDLDASRLEEILSIRTVPGERPAPARFSGTSILRPVWFREEELARNAEKKRRRGTPWSTVGGAVALGVLAALFSLTDMQHRREANRIAEIAPDAARVRNFQARWAELARAVDRDAFVLEIWRKVLSVPASSSVSLHRMEITREGVSLFGETESASEAFRFMDELARHSALSAFVWDFPVPEIREDGRAVFHLHGSAG